MKRNIVTIAALLTMGILRDTKSQKLRLWLTIISGIAITIMLFVNIIKKKLLSEILSVLLLSILCILLLIDYNRDIFNNKWLFILFLFIFIVLLPVVGTYNAYQKEDWKRFRNGKLAIIIFFIMFIVVSVLIISSK